MKLRMYSAAANKLAGCVVFVARNRIPDAKWRTRAGTRRKHARNALLIAGSGWGVHGAASVELRTRPIGASTPDVKTPEVPLRLVPADFRRLNSRIRLGRLVPFDAGFDAGTIALEHRLDAAVGSVLNVAVESERHGLLGTVRAEVDTLDASAENHDGAGLHRVAIRAK